MTALERKAKEFNSGIKYDKSSGIKP